MDGGVSELAAAANVLEPLTLDAIPNLAKVIPEGLYKKADNSIYAVSTGFYALGLVYNTNEIKTAPTSWEDLWNPKYAGIVTIPSPANAMRSEEHTSELQSLMRISYAVSCLKKKHQQQNTHQ